MTNIDEEIENATQLEFTNGVFLINSMRKKEGLHPLSTEEEKEYRRKLYNLVLSFYKFILTKGNVDDFFMSNLIKLSHLKGEFIFGEKNTQQIEDFIEESKQAYIDLLGGENILNYNPSLPPDQIKEEALEQKYLMKELSKALDSGDTKRENEILDKLKKFSK